MTTALILGLLVAGGTQTVSPPRPFRLVAPAVPFASPLFRAPVAGSSLSQAKPWKFRKLSEDADRTTFCGMTVIEANPDLDPKITRDAPKDLDPKIAKTGDCAAPATRR